MQIKPIFVIGTPRSGTTLTAKILGRNSLLFMPGETHFFPDIYSQRDSIGDLRTSKAREELFSLLKTLYGRYNEPEDQKRIEKILNDAHGAAALKGALGSYQQAMSAFMQIQAGLQGKTRWGNNVPKDIFFVDDILELYPHAQFILCVRDVRDFLYSYKSKWKATTDEQAERLRKLYHPVVTSLLWKASMKLVPMLKQRLGKNSLYVLRYEELVTRPEQVIKSLCTYIGESFEGQMLDIDFSNSSDGRKVQGISSDSVGRWRESLSPEEAWIAQYIAGQELVRLGYKKESLRVNPAKVFWFMLTMPSALWMGLKANRENTGPIVPYLIRRMKYLITS